MPEVGQLREHDAFFSISSSPQDEVQATTATSICLPGPAEEAENRGAPGERGEEEEDLAAGMHFLPPLRNCALEPSGLGNRAGAAGAGGGGWGPGAGPTGSVGWARAGSAGSVGGPGEGPARGLRGRRGASSARRAPQTPRSGRRLAAVSPPPPSERARSRGWSDVSRGPRARPDRCDVAQARGGATEERPEALGDSEEQLLLHPAAASRAWRGGRPSHG